jgi:hypothetical protein
MHSPKSNPQVAWSHRDRVVFTTLLLAAALCVVPLGLQIANGEPLLEGSPWSLGIAAAGIALAAGFAAGKWLRDTRFPPLLVLAVMLLMNLPHVVQGVQRMVRGWPPSPTVWMSALAASLVSGVVAYLVSRHVLKRRPPRD